ncbi:MAG: YqeG family HAD IIIA-type phosphatase [Bacilli bacterium]|nr:YqeG family HAD IIIA-type phosphatase [Bacilli bacterium]
MNNFIPDIYVKNIFSIDYKKLKQDGIKCILFDLDNTIAPISENKPSKDVKELFSYIDDLNIKTIILSNSKKNRVAPFKEQLNIDSACLAMKPLKRKYKKVLKMFGYEFSEVAAIGDQILTDVFGANRCGITSIFVDKLSDEEKFKTKINRKFEKIILNNLKKKGIYEFEKYYGN